MWYSICCALTGQWRLMRERGHGQYGQSGPFSSFLLQQTRVTMPPPKVKRKGRPGNVGRTDRLANNTVSTTPKINGWNRKLSIVFGGRPTDFCSAACCVERMNGTCDGVSRWVAVPTDRDEKTDADGGPRTVSTKYPLTIRKVH